MTVDVEGQDYRDPMAARRKNSSSDRGGMYRFDGFNDPLVRGRP